MVCCCRFEYASGTGGTIIYDAIVDWSGHASFVFPQTTLSAASVTQDDAGREVVAIVEQYGRFEPHSINDAYFRKFTAADYTASPRSA